VVVIDAIGEFDTIGIYAAEYVDGRAKYTKLWGQRYPHSIGLFYSAMTKEVGLKPMEEEYILMGMAAYGGSQPGAVLKKQLVEDLWEVRFNENLHIGTSHPWSKHFNPEDLARATQHIAEELIYNVMQRAKDFGFSTNLVYQGGVALNCLANRNLGEDLPMEGRLTGEMRTLATRSQENILQMPSSIVYSVIESSVSLVAEPSLDPELLEIEVSSPTQEDWI
jgi:carbamoyltransferase